ncbi:transposon ty3-I gag-pol polyprotein [Tanacetum coccineum]
MGMYLTQRVGESAFGRIKSSINSLADFTVKVPEGSRLQYHRSLELDSKTEDILEERRVNCSSSIPLLGALRKNNQNSLQVRHVKLDFPRFDGSNPLNWLFRAEHFFTYYDTHDVQRLTIASVHFEGSVVPWFQMLHKANQIPNWDALASAIEEHFGPSQYDSPRVQLFKLTQTTSVADYYHQFTVMANRVEGLSSEALLDCFLSRLKDHMRRDVIAQEPKSLIHAVSQETIEPHVSLNVYHGSNWVATIHLSGSINGTKVKVLLNGATDAIIEAYTIHCFSMDSTQDDTLKLPDTIPHDLASVLHGFTIVFSVPTRLPPSRTQDHSIVLHEGINVVKVLPYRYPVSQKAQIETMVADMLAQGLIQPSSSLFSAPILLVQKKDGTWHFL